MVIILMGVSGSGKSTIGTRLAQVLGWTYLEGDDYQPIKNKEKMGAGIPLKDADRFPWLQRLAELIQEKKEHIIVGCSALKKQYREKLSTHPGVVFVYLKGEVTLIKKRMEQRKEHFFNSKMLGTQFADLEEPVEEPMKFITVTINDTIEGVINQIRQKLQI